MTALWLFLLAFRPIDPGLSVGPPVPKISHAPAVQWRLSARQRWRGFQDAWPGKWAVRWDPGRATPRFLWAPGVPANEAGTLVGDVARLAGVDASELHGPRITTHGDRRILHWDRSHKGAPVVGDRIALVVQGEAIGGIWAQLTPVPQRLDPAGDQVVFPLPPRAMPVLATVAQEGTEVVVRSPQGKVLHRYETRYASTVNLSVEERTVDDPLIVVPARGIRVRSGSERWTTDDDGVWDGGTPEDLVFNGDLLRIRNNGSPIVVPAADPLEEPWLVAGGEDVPLAANTVLHNVHVTWDWLEERWPDHPWLSMTMAANVESDADVCNAWYDGTSITFLRADPARCHNFGRISDVVFHELGHAVHHRILATGTYASDVSEGSSDFLSATLNDDSRVGINAFLDGSEVRDIGPDRRYPDHFIGESHNDGLIWASFLWNLRGDWAAASETGVWDVDMLFLRTLEQGPTLLDIYEAVLLADDDDGDLSSGTPHDCELMGRLDGHGIGPGPIGVIEFDHVPLTAQESAAEGYRVDFILSEMTPDCGDLDPDSVRVWFATDESGVPGVEEESFDTGLTEPDTGLEFDTGAPGDVYYAWEEVVPERDGEAWSALIPRQPANSQVRYFIEAASGDGTQRVQTHGGRADGVWSFWVGDRRVLWCDGFEDGGEEWSHSAGLPGAVEVDPTWTSEWSFSTPTGSTWGPDAPYDGALVAVTALDSDYTNLNQQHLSSPVIDLSDAGPMLMLTSQRWLTVEDGIYDVAQVWADTVPAWTNPNSPGGVRHTLDDGWTLHDVPLEGLIDDPSRVQFHWSLQSDPGLEFGGWALDDVCVVDLDDVPGHYRVRDLTASDDAPEITIAWTQPWVQPMRSTILVRKAAEPPLDPMDGVEIELDDAPIPGAARRVVDTEVGLDEEVYYALFVVGPDWDDVWTELVLGENLAVGRASIREDTGSPGDTGALAPGGDSGIMQDTGGESGEPGEAEGTSDSGDADRLQPYTPTLPKSGCACSLAGPDARAGRRTGGPWLLLGLIVLARRQARRATPAV